jgi:hypothetical protein
MAKWRIAALLQPPPKPKTRGGLFTLLPSRFYYFLKSEKAIPKYLQIKNLFFKVKLIDAAFMVLIYCIGF